MIFFGTLMLLLSQMVAPLPTCPHSAQVMIIPWRCSNNGHLWGVLDWGLLWAAGTMAPAKLINYAQVCVCV